MGRTISEACGHTDQIQDVTPQAEGCVTCLEIGARWVHLRLCKSCGYIGCCDSSPNKHASAHHRETKHPLMQSFEPNQDWLWCFVDEVAFELEGEPSFSHP
jgi:uncharacterized UBP type Zn finger protein